MCIDFRWHLLYSYNRDFFAPIFPTSSIVFMNTMQSLMTWYFHEASSEAFRGVHRFNTNFQQTTMALVLVCLSWRLWHFLAIYHAFILTSLVKVSNHWKINVLKSHHTSQSQRWSKLVFRRTTSGESKILNNEGRKGFTSNQKKVFIVHTNGKTN